MRSELVEETSEVALVHLHARVALPVSVLDALSAGFLTALAETAWTLCKMQHLRFLSPMVFVFCVVHGCPVEVTKSLQKLKILKMFLLKVVINL